MNLTRLNKTTLAIAITALISASNAFAIQQVKLNTFNSGSAGNYRADPNSEFEYILDNYVLGKSTDGTWFGTFCIEFNEHFNPGHTYDVALNNGSVNGGQSGAVNGKDIISVATAWLYKNFAMGTLTGFIYGNQTHAQQLQNTIWELEGETSAPNDFGTFMGLATSLSNWNSDYTGKEVGVMNLTKNNGTSLHQDQLVFHGAAVPDSGSALALFAIGLTGLAAVRRRITPKA